MTDVRRPLEYHEMMERLKDNEEGVFLTFKDCLVFCACLGHSEGRRVEFDKSAERVPMTVFRGEYDEAVINAIALVTTNDPTIMGVNRQAERIRIFEEYACGGLEILKARVFNTPESYSDAMMTLIQQGSEDGGSKVLDDITNLFG